MVIGLNPGGEAGIFADYSQWEAARGETSPTGEKPVREARVPEPAGPKRKLSYIEQREWDAMEGRILEAEEALATWHREVQDASSDAQRLPVAYQQLQDAQHRVDELYARWAELESKIAK
jgi:ATP-binding cassette subfamily F protein uup